MANKDSISSLGPQSSPLVAFVVAESALAIGLVHVIHQSLATMNRSLKSGLVLSVSLMESAIEITSMKVYILSIPIIAVFLLSVYNGIYPVSADSEIVVHFMGRAFAS